MEKQKLTPHQLADKWISELSADGYTYNDMLTIFKEARRQYDAYKLRLKKIKHS
jgi:hypothetical protein